MMDEKRWCRVVHTRPTTLRQAKLDAGSALGGFLTRRGMTPAQRRAAEAEEDRIERATRVEGSVIWMCGRGTPPVLCVHGYESAYLCDYPMGGGRTCDTPMCEECRRRVGRDLDLCRLHFAQWRDAPRLVMLGEGGDPEDP